MFKAKYYLLTPGDVMAWFHYIVRHVTRKDIVVAVLLLLTATGALIFLQWELSTIVFLAFLFIVLWWRVDGRIPIVFSLLGLVVCAISLTLHNQDLFSYGDVVAENIAVWVYFLLVIGVVRQAVELKWPKVSVSQKQKPSGSPFPVIPVTFYPPPQPVQRPRKFTPRRAMDSISQR